MREITSNSQYANRWQFKLAAGELELPPIAGLARQTRNRFQNENCWEITHTIKARDVVKQTVIAMSEGDRTEAPLKEPISTSPVQSSTAAPSKLDYSDQLKQDFNRLFGSMNLSPLQLEFLKSRWLDQVLWMEGKASVCRDRHFRLRLVTIIGGVIVPILVTLNGGNNAKVQAWLKGATIGLSGLVAVSSAVEEFFHYGDRWYNYRRAAESLKAQGWQFFQLSGTYRAYKTHEDAFAEFVDQIEDIIQRDVEIYVTQNKQSKEQQEDNPHKGEGSSVD
jgi:hypothetical protein